MGSARYRGYSYEGQGAQYPNVPESTSDASIQLDARGLLSFARSPLLRNRDEALDRELLIASRLEKGLLSRGSAAALQLPLRVAGILPAWAPSPKQFNLNEKSVHSGTRGPRNKFDYLESAEVVDPLPGRREEAFSVKISFRFQYWEGRMFPLFVEKFHNADNGQAVLRTKRPMMKLQRQENAATASQYHLLPY